MAQAVFAGIVLVVLRHGASPVSSHRGTQPLTVSLAGHRPRHSSVETQLHSVETLLDAWADGLPVQAAPLVTPPSTAEAYVSGFMAFEQSTRRRARGLRRFAHAAAAGDAHSVETGGEHEDDVWLPEPTQLKHCVAQVDGSELCVYGNVCIDVLTSGDTVGENNFLLLFIDSSAIPPTEELPKIKTEHADTRRTGPPNPGTGIDAADTARRARHAARLTIQGGKHDLREILRGGDDFFAHEEGWDSVYEDIRNEKEYLAGRRRVPYSFGTRTRVIPPESTVPSHLGGSFNGTVAWVDNLYLGRLLQGGHMWGCSSSLLFPVFGAWFANAASAPSAP